MSDRKTSSASIACISSQARDSGTLRAISPDGGDLFGPLPAPASPFPSREKAPASMIQGTCGPTHFDSSASAGLGSSWANRLAARLAMVGSTESSLIWKASATLAGRSIFRLAPSTRRIEETESIGSRWPTPMIPNGGRALNAESCLTQKRPNGTKVQVPLESLMRVVCWPTPTVADVTGGRKTRSGSRNDEMLLNGLLANWSTPTISNGGSEPTGGTGRKLVTQMVQASLWATQTAHERTSMSRDVDHGQQLANQIAGRFGPIVSGSATPTEKRGASNPEFACWLMGWSEEFTSGVLQAIQSYLKSRPKSSARSKTNSTSATRRKLFLM